LPLEFISDEEGCVAIGWVGANVLYARLVGGISAEMGRAHAARISGFADRVQSLRLYLDGSRVTHYDLLARSAFVRAILSSRRKFEALVVLTFSQESSAAEASFVGVLGMPLELLRDPNDFKTRLVIDAPQARQVL
jgi:hypothetical protein